MRDDLEQVKSDIRNMSDKLETLRSSETEDKGQFLGMVYSDTLFCSVLWRFFGEIYVGKHMDFK